MPAFIPYFCGISSLFRRNSAAAPVAPIVNRLYRRLVVGQGLSGRDIGKQKLTRGVLQDGVSLERPQQNGVLKNAVSLRRPLQGAPYIGFWVCSVVLAQAAGYIPSKSVPPAPTREMRAVWVATVANIDWPSTNGLSTAEQKAELVAMLDRAADLRINTVIFQVRPSCDSLYPSAYEPWSEYLTGTMGKAPTPFYDPLAFAVEEAHKRGLELHAWFNPYRARHSGAKSAPASTHISQTHPELVRRYGQFLWVDPGEKAVQDYSLKIVMDVVRRYNIDGVHFDDYFYPYKEKDAFGGELDFPDDSSWQRYGAGGRLSRDDWPRENVNAFIHRVYDSIKSVKPWIKFGVSPFGIWRPGNPQQIEGYDAYAKLYADSRQWLAKGWLDYCAPQLYWAIKPPEQSFPVLLKWWTEQNAKGRVLVAGLDCTKVNGRWPVEEIINQIRLTRRQPGASGDVHWNMKSLMRNETLAQALKREVYAQPAISPALTWLSDDTAPAELRLSITSGASSTRANWNSGKKEGVWLWVLQFRSKNEWSTRVLPARTTHLALSRTIPDVIAITAIDRYGNASRPTVLEHSF